MTTKSPNININNNSPDQEMLGEVGRILAEKTRIVHEFAKAQRKHESELKSKNKEFEEFVKAETKTISDQITGFKTDADTKLAEIKPSIDELPNKITEIIEKVPNAEELKKTITDTVGALSEQFTQQTAEVEKLTNELKAQIEAIPESIGELTAAVDAQKTELANTIAKQTNEFKTQTETLNGTITQQNAELGAIKTGTADLKTQIENLVASSGNIADAKTELLAKLEEQQKKLDAIEAANDNAKTELKTAMETAQKSIPTTDMIGNAIVAALNASQNSQIVKLTLEINKLTAHIKDLTEGQNTNANSIVTAIKGIQVAPNTAVPNIVPPAPIPVGQPGPKNKCEDPYYVSTVWYDLYYQFYTNPTKDIGGHTTTDFVNGPWVYSESKYNDDTADTRYLLLEKNTAANTPTEKLSIFDPSKNGWVELNDDNVMKTHYDITKGYSKDGQQIKLEDLIGMLNEFNQNCIAPAAPATPGATSNVVPGQGLQGQGAPSGPVVPSNP